MIGLVAATAAGRAGAATLTAAWPDAKLYDGPVGQAVRAAFAECHGLVCFLATGATIRLLAPLLADKSADPGVVCVDEARRFSVALLGGHAGGANALAGRVAATLGCEPVVTTASDAACARALDSFGAECGLWVESDSDLAAVGGAMLSGEPVCLDAEATWPLPALPPNVRPGHRPPRIAVSDRCDVGATGGPTAVYRPPSLVVGVGASRGAPAEEVLALVEDALAGAGLSARSVCRLATVEAKRDEPGLVLAARAAGWPLVTHPADELARVAVPHPSELVRAAVGTPSVAEAAALLPDPQRAELVGAKRRSAHATVAVGRHRPRGRLSIVGLGPGARDLLAPRAVEALQLASVVVGLEEYIDQVRDLLRPGTRILGSGLGAEQARALAAVEEARAGHSVALVGSGDAGVYAMASPALDAADGSFDVVGVPGITAALAAAALLGAPLGHDHAAVSLSDLHTPWEVIESRVAALATADLVVTFYNPRSRQRTWQLPRALDLMRDHRPPATPVGVVTAATRPGERVLLTTLAAVDPTMVGMRSVVVVGSGASRIVAGRFVTPRGYRWDRPTP